MSCPRIVNPSLAIAVAFGCFALCLAPCCLAVAVIDTEGLTQELLVPFNDLLPPLSDAEFQEAQTTSTTSTTTTTTAAPPVTEAPVSKTTTTRAPTKVTTPKPTKSATAQKLKKTQYQLDQQSQKQPLAVPILDLNPEVPPALPEAEPSVASQATETPLTPKTVVVATTTTTTQAPPTTRAPGTTTKAPVKVSEPKQAASTQHFQQVQTAQTQFQGLEQHRQPQQQYNPQPQQQQQQFAKQAPPQPTAQHRFQPQVAAAIAKVAPSSPQRNAPAAKQVNVEHLRQYLEYIYQPTTRRPSRGPLPTLTPFPRHFK
ncbi:PREDICTED: putative mediator of RNA polymerase II transcription subunit 12 [Bactrocera latifrons]|uniref:Uncharacterized protein n=1 Tax=Bactrocera latifrons TaxID=174628 RepID=A0A0K8WLM3_BACLA|nr:PREDICTED: putative mediator of RNA polymerase II transcription subunit 12 [Bactrocera latifrons]